MALNVAAAMTKQRRFASLLFMAVVWWPSGRGVIVPRMQGTCQGVSDSSSHGLAAYRNLYRNTQHWFALPRRANSSPPDNSRTYSQLNREPGVAAIRAGSFADHMLCISSIGRGCPDVAAIAPGAIHAGNVTMYPTNSTPWTSGTG